MQTQPAWHFENSHAEQALTTQFPDDATWNTGIYTPTIVCAAGALMRYIQDTQKTHLPHIQQLALHSTTDYLLIDAASRRHLEITENLQGNTQHTLAALLDTTQTSMGSRLLKRWLNQPLVDIARIQARQAALQLLIEQQLYLSLQAPLSTTNDVERVLARVALRSARPRDLTALRQTLETTPDLHQRLTPAQDAALLQHITQSLVVDDSIVTLLQTAIIAEPPMLIRDGGVIASGFDA